MIQAKQGDTVKVNYTGKLENGQVFDSTENRDSLEFTIGEGHVIPGFEKAVIGMTLGETKQANVTADEGYGPYHKELVLEIGRDQIPPELEPEVGQHLQIRQDENDNLLVRVVEVTENSVKLDANHPLAGQNLAFDIELVAVT